MVYDVAIIGAGVVGTLIARAFSKYDINVALIERTADVAMGTTKANSGIVHAGFDAQTGTMKAKLNVRGCALMEDLCKELFVPYEKNGSLVVAFTDKELEHIKVLYDRGIANGVPDMEIIDAAKLRELEPNISEEAKGALWAKSAGIVSPYELDDLFTIKCKCGKKEVAAKLVINAAGLGAAEIAKKFNGEEYEVIGRLGEYGLLDRSCADTCSHTIFQCPNEMGKGVLVTPSCHHNILVGPSSVNVEDVEDMSVRVGALRQIFATAQKSVPMVSTRDMITSFAGIRAHHVDDDFIITPAKDNNKFINLIGIESPGLASSPAIAEYVEDMVVNTIGKPAEKSAWNPSRKAPVIFRELPPEKQEALIAENPAYARVICRCETITEGEIRDAIKAPAGAIDIDGVKRRTRAGMGRCQGGFCGSKVLEILAEELGVPKEDISKFGGDSQIIYERTK